MIACMIGYFYHDVPRGRDDASYLTAAINLVEHQSLSFQDIITTTYHGYRQIDASQHVFTSQFLPGYIVYLALFYLIGNVTGIMLANMLIYLFALYILYAIIRTLAHDKIANLGVILFATSYTAVWFPRRTLSENIFLFLTWFSIWLFLEGYKKLRWTPLFLGFIPSSLLIFIRGEGIAFFVCYFLCVLSLIIANKWKDTKSSQKLISLANQIVPKSHFPQTTWQTTIIMIISITISLLHSVLLFVYSQKFGSSYLNTSFQATKGIFTNPVIAIITFVLLLGAFIFFFLSKHTRSRIRKIIVVCIFSLGIVAELWYTHYLQKVETISWTSFKYQFILENFWYYLIIPYIILIFIGIYQGFFKRKELFLLFLASPSFIFLISPAIAVDQPWFMRRYFAVLIPLIFILASIVISRLKLHPSKVLVIFFVFICINISISYPLFKHREHRGVRDDFATLQKRFTEKDLILMEPGWHWQQWGFGLYYIYNIHVLPNLDGLSAQDLAQLIDDHENIYILSTENTNAHPTIPDSNLDFQFEWTLGPFPRLTPTTWIAEHVNKNKYSLDLLTVRSSQNGTPPREIRQIEETYYIFQVKDKHALQFEIK